MDRKRLKQEQNRARSEKRRRIEESLKEVESSFNDISFDESSEDESDHEENVDGLNIEEVVYSLENSLNLDSDSAENLVSNRNLLEQQEETGVIEDDFINQVLGESTEDDSSGGEEVNDNEEQHRINVPPEIMQLRKLAIEKEIPQNVLDPLLGILRQRLLPSLPMSSKTFLKTTDARYNIINIENSDGGTGEFIYFGIASGLRRNVNVDIHTENVLYIQIFIDGMPLSKSGNSNFWATLCRIHFDPDVYKVFPVSIYSGKSKPKNLDDYLEDLVHELNDLQKDGMEINNRQFDVNLKCIICDTPARAFVKNTLGHRGFLACERCEVEGHSEDRTTVFPSVDARERTDASFRNLDQAGHHHGPSPFNRVLPQLNMIQIFILDFMHLCCLGVMKKLLEYWLTGDFNVRFGVREKEDLATQMNILYSQIPAEFQRKPRSTKFLAKWKAVEFRFFLLYCGPIVLKNILRADLYKHFLLLHASCRILCSDTLCTRYTERAKIYLRAFFMALRDYYGPKSQSLNAHHLIHLADDVLSMQCSLSRITAFAFESYLGKLKKMLRTANRPLAQVCRRLNERHFCIDEKPTQLQLFEILKKKGERIEKVKYNQVVICTSEPNNMVFLENNVLQVHGIFDSPEGLQLEARVWGKKRPIFTYPFNSERLNMWELENEPHYELGFYSLNSIKSKLVKLTVPVRDTGRQKIYVIPLLH